MKQLDLPSSQDTHEPSPLSENQKRGKAILMAMEWIKVNKPDLAAYIPKYLSGGARKDPTGARYFVGLTVDGPHGKVHFSFWADLEKGSLEQVPWQR